MGYALADHITYDSLTCGECGIVFYVNAGWLSDKRDSGGKFSCPNGHPRIFKESEADRLRRELKAKEAEVEFQRTRANRAAAEQNKLLKERARLKKRIAAGVCPCCHRTVSQLANHMKTQHPDYATAAPRT
jgi:ribosomal protein S27AE